MRLILNVGLLLLAVAFVDSKSKAKNTLIVMDVVLRGGKHRNPNGNGSTLAPAEETTAPSAVEPTGKPSGNVTVGVVVYRKNAKGAIAGLETVNAEQKAEAVQCINDEECWKKAMPTETEPAKMILPDKKFEQLIYIFNEDGSKARVRSFQKRKRR